EQQTRSDSTDSAPPDEPAQPEEQRGRSTETIQKANGPKTPAPEEQRNRRPHAVARFRRPGSRPSCSGGRIPSAVAKPRTAGADGGIAVSDSPHPSASGATAQAVVLDEPGSHRLVSGPQPLPGPGEVRVAVHSAGVCAS